MDIVRNQKGRHREEDELLFKVARAISIVAVAFIIGFVIFVGMRQSYAPSGYVPDEVRNLQLETVKPSPTVSARVGPATPTPSPQPVKFDSCEEAARAEAFPLKRGEPGYNSKLDTDDDGRACENFD
jgi:hypothetical protein